MRCPLTPKKEGATSSRECSLQKRRGCICECGLLSAALCWESALSVPLLLMRQEAQRRRAVIGRWNRVGTRLPLESALAITVPIPGDRSEQPEMLQLLAIQLPELIRQRGGRLLIQPAAAHVHKRSPHPEPQAAPPALRPVTRPRRPGLARGAASVVT